MVREPRNQDYPAFLAALKKRIVNARTKAARTINRELVLLYWDIGRRILEKQQTAGRGDSVVEQLAADLRTAFPHMSGFSVANLWRMKQLFLEHNAPEFLSQAVRELVATVPWGHHANLLSKITDPAARLYYLRATAQHGWSRNVLLNQIKARAYERAVKEKKTNNFVLALPEHFAEQANEMMKSRYNLEFLGISR